MSETETFERGLETETASLDFGDAISTSIHLVSWPAKFFYQILLRGNTTCTSNAESVIYKTGSICDSLTSFNLRD
jgi:hypothetical protein